MPELYVIRRPFKSAGEFYAVGTILDDLSPIKLSKVKLNEGKIQILPKDEKQLENLCDYYKTKLGVDLAANLAERVSKGSNSAETGNTGAGAIQPNPGTILGPTTVTAQVVQPKVLTPGAPKPLSQGVPNKPGVPNVPQSK